MRFGSMRRTGDPKPLPRRESAGADSLPSSTQKARSTGIGCQAESMREPSLSVKAWDCAEPAEDEDAQMLL